MTMIIIFQSLSYSVVSLYVTFPLITLIVECFHVFIDMWISFGKKIVSFWHFFPIISFRFCLLICKITLSCPPMCSHALPLSHLFRSLFLSLYNIYMDLFSKYFSKFLKIFLFAAFEIYKLEIYKCLDLSVFSFMVFTFIVILRGAFPSPGFNKSTIPCNGFIILFQN